jgi:ubiquitin carboxyl-terminal hydrolase 35/38
MLLSFYIMFVMIFSLCSRYLLNTLHEQEQGKSKPQTSSNNTKPEVSEPGTSTSPNQPLKRWTTEEDLSDADPAALLNGRRKARSLATFDETSPPSSNGPPPTPAPPPLTDAYSDSKDSGIHSVGSTDEEEEDTLVQGVFGGRQTTVYKCLQCAFEYKTVDKFLDLQLALPPEDKGLSIPDLISYFLQPEQLTGDNKYHCRRCNLLQDATKTITIEKAPEHLILTIKRFCYEPSTNSTAKLTVPVKCPTSILLAGQQYELYAVVLHAGSSPHSGHYHSQVRSLTHAWLWLNDEVVSGIPGRDWSGADTPYVLFYKQSNLSTPTMELSLSALLPRLQSLIEDDTKSFRQENRLSIASSSSSDKSHQPPPPPPSGGGLGGCGENLNTLSSRYIC